MLNFFGNFRIFHKSSEGQVLKFGINYYGNFFTGSNTDHSWISLKFFIPYGISIFPYFYNSIWTDAVYCGRVWSVLRIYIRRRSDHRAEKCGKRWIFKISTGTAESKNRKLHRTKEQVEDEKFQKPPLGKPPLWLVWEVGDAQLL